MRERLERADDRRLERFRCHRIVLPNLKHLPCGGWGGASEVGAGLGWQGSAVGIRGRGSTGVESTRADATGKSGGVGEGCTAELTSLPLLVVLQHLGAAGGSPDRCPPSLTLSDPHPRDMCGLSGGWGGDTGLRGLTQSKRKTRGKQIVVQKEGGWGWTQPRAHALCAQ